MSKSLGMSKFEGDPRMEQALAKVADKSVEIEQRRADWERKHGSSQRRMGARQQLVLLVLLGSLLGFLGMRFLLADAGGMSQEFMIGTFLWIVVIALIGVARKQLRKF
jgi:hypothetical protein